MLKKVSVQRAAETLEDLLITRMLSDFEPGIWKFSSSASSNPKTPSVPPNPAVPLTNPSDAGTEDGGEMSPLSLTPPDVADGSVWDALLLQQGGCASVSLC